MAEPSVSPPQECRRGRRRFLQAAVKVIGGLVAAVGAVPMVAMLFGPIRRKPQTYFSRVGPIDGFPIGKPANPTLEYRTDDAYLRTVVLVDVWVVRRSATEVTVFSSICPHLGCHVYWDSNAQRFICPCHASIFTMDGHVVGGPAPRPLDTLNARVEDGVLMVEWQRFQMGVSGKVLL
jgi:Rieske Fe-S protein